MFFRRYKKHSTDRSRTSRRPYRSTHLGIERLEDRNLLAVMWINDGATNNADLFNIYEGNAELARSIVRRAVADWNAVIADQNVDRDNNPNTNNNFELTINGAFLGSGIRGDATISEFTTGLASQGQSGWTVGAPRKATVRVDDNAAGAGWFFDQTPTDDAEFTAIANSGATGTGAAFAASFIDVNGQSIRDDFYRTVVHEIGHALGITSDPNAAISGMLKLLYRDSAQQQALIDPTGISSSQLTRFQSTRTSPQFGQVATFIGGHLYEGDLYGANNDPSVVYAQGSSSPLTFVTHSNELLNPGRAVPAGHPDPVPPTLAETARQFISDLDARILADAYGYTVVLPSTFNTAHVTLDSQTGTLLIQGGVTSQGVTQNDIVIIDTVGSDVRVTLKNTANVTYATEKVPATLVRQIVISAAGDSSPAQVSGVSVPVHTVYWVVSSNQDALDPGALGNVFVDLDTVVPGQQVSVRAAIQDATAPVGSGGSIYLPRGKYRLSLTGTGGIEQGDLDIVKSTTIIGTGGGETIIDAGGDAGILDRVFEVLGSGQTLTLDSLTVTGGRAPINQSTGKCTAAGSSFATARRSI